MDFKDIGQHFSLSNMPQQQNCFSNFNSQFLVNNKNPGGCFNLNSFPSSSGNKQFISQSGVFQSTASQSKPNLSFTCYDSQASASNTVNTPTKCGPQGQKLLKYMKEIDGEYICYSTHIIGKGSFGKVVYGKNTKDEDICFKFEKISNHKNNSILSEEYRIYKYLEGGIGIPKILKFGKYRSSRYLAMELIGPSLDKYFNLCEKKFNLETTLFLGLQMLERIEFVHSRGIVHRDIKPNNFLFGKFKKTMDSGDSTLYVIDFGLSASYLEQVNQFNSGGFLNNNTPGSGFGIQTSNNNLTNNSALNINNTNKFGSGNFTSNMGNTPINRPQAKSYFPNLTNTDLSLVFNKNLAVNPERVVLDKDKEPTENKDLVINITCNQTSNPSNVGALTPPLNNTTSQSTPNNTHQLFHSNNMFKAAPNTISPQVPCFRHIPIKEGCRFVGTPRYASLNTHQGTKQSRRDDLESIAYIMVYFVLGDLPWQGVKAKTKSEKKEKIRLLKYSLSIEDEPMFKSLPQELKQFLRICRNTPYECKPNYSELKNLLVNLRIRMGYGEAPPVFQWEEFFVGESPYSHMKKKYKTLFEGYPTIPVSEYIDLIEKKKNESYPKQNNDNSDISLLETQTQSEINKSKSSQPNNIGANVSNTLKDTQNALKAQINQGNQAKRKQSFKENKGNNSNDKIDIDNIKYLKDNENQAYNMLYNNPNSNFINEANLNTFENDYIQPQDTTVLPANTASTLLAKKRSVNSLNNNSAKKSCNNEKSTLIDPCLQRLNQSISQAQQQINQSFKSPSPNPPNPVVSAEPSLLKLNRLISNNTYNSNLTNLEGLEIREFNPSKETPELNISNLNSKLTYNKTLPQQGKRKDLLINFNPERNITSKQSQTEAIFNNKNEVPELKTSLINEKDLDILNSLVSKTLNPEKKNKNLFFQEETFAPKPNNSFKIEINQEEAARLSQKSQSLSKSKGKSHSKQNLKGNELSTEAAQTEDHLLKRKNSNIIRINLDQINTDSQRDKTKQDSREEENVKKDSKGKSTPIEAGCAHLSFAAESVSKNNSNTADNMMKLTSSLNKAYSVNSNSLFKIKLPDFE